MKRLLTILLLGLMILLLVGLCACGGGENPPADEPPAEEPPAEEPPTQEPTVENVTVAFDSNGGTPVASQSVEKGENISKPTDPTRENYTFDGWYANDEKWSFNGYVVTKDITLVAKWVPTPFTITYVGAKCSAVSYTVEDEVVLPAGTDLDEFWFFDGWYEDEAFIKPIAKIEKGTVGNKTFYAKAHYDPFVYESLDYGYMLVECKDKRIENVIVPSQKDGRDVISIGDCAFYNCAYLKTIVIPNSVQSIELDALSGCPVLEEVTIPFVGDGGENVHFGYIFGALTYETNATTVPNRIKKLTITGGERIGNYAFYGCEGLTSIVIGDQVKEIGEYAFAECKNIDNVTIGNGVTTIERAAFDWSTAITSIKLGNSVQSLGDYTFSGCESLESIELPDSLTTVAYNSFNECKSLERVVVGNCSININPGLFSTSASLKEIVVKEENAKYKSIDGVLYTKDLSTIILYPRKKDGGSFAIPSGVATIGSSAFSGCTGLTSIEIPNSVLSIGSYAFNGCISLESAEIPNGVQAVESGTFSGCKGIKTIKLPNGIKTIGGSAFNGCASLESIEIPKTTETIGFGAFTGCYDLAEISLPFTGNINDMNRFGYLFSNWLKNDNTYVPSSLKKVTIIGERPIGEAFFKDCDNIETIIIDGSVKEIGSSAFRGCTGLTSAEISNGVTAIGSSAFSGCTGLTSVEISNGVTAIDAHAFEYCTGLASIEIPNSVTTIGFCAFYNCTGFTSVEIPNSVTAIGEYAFKGCTGLKEITVPFTGNGSDKTNFSYIFGYLPSNLKKVTITGEHPIVKDAFKDCGNIETVIIGGAVTEIGEYAFAGCAGLTSVEISNCVTAIGSYAFYNCTGLTSVEISNGVTAIGYSAFRDCTGLTSIEIPNSVTTIGSYAFNGCTWLTSVEIPKSVTTIGDYAFYKTGATIYCEAMEEPDGWADYWIYFSERVVWGYKPE